MVFRFFHSLGARFWKAICYVHVLLYFLFKFVSDYLCPIHFSGFFEPVFRAALILLSRVSPVSFLLFSNIFLCVCISIFSLQMFSSPTIGPRFLLLFLSIAPATGQRGETERA